MVGEQSMFQGEGKSVYINDAEGQDEPANCVIDIHVRQEDELGRLFLWWMMTAASDFLSTVPKMLEYGGSAKARPGSADLRVVGEGLMELLDWPVTDETSAVSQELGCWFYDLGKGGRLISDYQQRRHGKADTWFDKTIYAMMARRIQSVGTWP